MCVPFVTDTDRRLSAVVAISSVELTVCTVRVCQVRLAVTEVAGRWLVELPDRYSFFAKILPLLLTRSVPAAGWCRTKRRSASVQFLLEISFLNGNIICQSVARARCAAHAILNAIQYMLHA